MQCQILFSRKDKKNISLCRLLKILPRVPSLNFAFQHNFELIFSHIMSSNRAKKNSTPSFAFSSIFFFSSANSSVPFIYFSGR